MNDIDSINKALAFLVKNLVACECKKTDSEYGDYPQRCQRCEVLRPLLGYYEDVSSVEE